MKALIFIQNLKQTLQEIEKSGGNPIFYVELDHKLVQKLKAYSINKLRENDKISTRDFVHDLLSRDIFNLRVKYCIVKLKELSIDAGVYFEYISKAIDLAITEPKCASYHRGSSSIEHSIIAEIAKCFQSWYRPDDLYLMQFAQERQLIFTNPREQGWIVSNLGRHFMKLSPFEAIAFLCGLEIVLTLEHDRSTLISKGLLEYLLKSDESDERTGLRHQYSIVPYSLSLFGIIKGLRYGSNVTITDFGHRVLSYVQSQLDYLQDVIIFLLESEITGFKYEPEINFENFLETINNAGILIEDQKESIRTGISLYKNGKLLDSLKVIFPVLEGTLDNVLKKINLSPLDFSGLKRKANELETKNLISTKLSMGLEICSTARNKIVHGNIIEEDTELVEPLVALTLRHLQRLVKELDTNLSK